MITLKRLTRWDEWAESKTPLFLAAAYTWLITGGNDDALIKITPAFLWVVFTICFLAFGYAINDFADRTADRLAGKPNAIGQWPRRRAVQFLALVGLAGPLVLGPYLALPWVATALLAAYFFAVAYSLPPIRFKERGVLGVIVSSTAQRLFPLMVGMAVFDRFDAVSWVMAAVLSLMGVRWILVHQIGDIEADARGGLNSFARAHGSLVSLRVMQGLVFPVEVICLAVWVMMAARYEVIVLVVWPVYFVWLTLAWRGQNRWPVSWTRFGELPLTRFYLVFWPSALAVGAAAVAPLSLLLLIGQLIIMRVYLAHEWRKLFPRRSIATS
jgi:4-hydroxybenzoate polyprenyltransferase